MYIYITHIYIYMWHTRIKKEYVYIYIYIIFTQSHVTPYILNAACYIVSPLFFGSWRCLSPMVGHRHLLCVREMFFWSEDYKLI